MSAERDFFAAKPELVQSDPWVELVRKERELGEVHERMLLALQYVQGKRDAALVLGDASKIQAKYLLEQADFGSVIDVDISPSLVDDEVIPLSEGRLKRIVSPFDGYMPPEESFNFIYGKSLAFNPKETTPEVLLRMHVALTEGGIFSAAWAGEHDEFRSKHYSQEELEQLYSQSGLRILHMDNRTPREVQGLSSTRVAHLIDIIAKRQ